MMAYNYPGAYSFYRPRTQPAAHSCYPAAYDGAGDSYANTLFAPPFTRRRPSPPPTTYVPRNASPNDYIRALAEEQAARSALAEAIQREQAARTRRERAEALARARAQEEARRKALESEYRRRARPQSVYGYPLGYSFYPEEYDDDHEEPEEQGSAASPFDFDALFYPSAMHRRAHSQGRPQPQPQAEPQHTTSQTREPRQGSPVHSTNVSSADEKNSSSPNGERVTIPISSSGEPQPAPVRHATPQPEATSEQNEAAEKIQAAYRSHAARVSALEEIEAIRSRLEELRNGFTFPAELDFEEDPASYLASYPVGADTDSTKPAEDSMDVEAESVEPPRPKLAYTSRNAPVHGHEDALLKLLQALDTIESGGDLSVRESRRAVVREVEDELKKVDESVRLRWKAILDDLLAKQAKEQVVEEKEVEQDMLVEERDLETIQDGMVVDDAKPAPEPMEALSTVASDDAMDVVTSPIPESEPTQPSSSGPIVTEAEDDDDDTMKSTSDDSLSSTSEPQAPFEPTTASEPIIEEVESSDSDSEAADDLSASPHRLSVSFPTHLEAFPKPSTQEKDDRKPEISEVSPVAIEATIPQSSEGEDVFSDAEEGLVEDADADLVHVELQSESDHEPPHSDSEQKEKATEDSEFVML